MQFTNFETVTFDLNVIGFRLRNEIDQISVGISHADVVFDNDH